MNTNTKPAAISIDRNNQETAVATQFSWERFASEATDEEILEEVKNREMAERHLEGDRNGDAVSRYLRAILGQRAVAKKTLEINAIHARNKAAGMWG